MRMSVREVSFWVRKKVIYGRRINNPHLNEQQVLMLRWLKKPLPDEDFSQMRRLAVQLLAKQNEDITDKRELENNITEEVYEIKPLTPAGRQ